MSENLKKIEEKKLASFIPDQDDLTVEKLRELLARPTLSEEEAREIILGISTLVDIIIDYQSEQEFNLNQAA
ncbi:MAG: hypothetical protein H0W61_08700 [Bacteroidetes bacterium]|nr:hypothetical protein [Bacteroidota bacterium]